MRYRADVPVHFPDTITLGLTDGAVIRCKPRVCFNLADLVPVGSVSSSLMVRIKIAIEREMDARRIEAGIPKYLVV
ncbi:hypothetical protein GSP01_15450 [Gluconobacter sphaericus NBRC 12467]|nr:hypothetical protein GSP01_15450 [Gluconobacter sphaericus NBRC 12467]